MQNVATLAGIFNILARAVTQEVIDVNMTTAYANICLAIGKRGDATQQKVSAIATEIRENTGVNVALTSRAVSTVFKQCCARIPAQTWPLVIRHFHSLIPQHIPRTRMLLVQAQGGGMTAYNTIIMAMKTYPTFNWGAIKSFYPQDWTNFEAARDVVNGDQYYGFRMDLGAAVSTRYKSLAFVAKKLLIRMGMVSLQKYQGGAKGVRLAENVNTLLEEFHATVTAQGASRKLRGRGRRGSRCAN